MTNIEIMLVNFHVWEAETPFGWGQHDCSLRLADWWKFMHGTDPADFLRGTYRTRIGAKATIISHGGLTSLVASLADRVGAQALDEMEIGAFGVAHADGADRGYIATADKISMRGEDARLVFLPRDAVHVKSIWGVV